MCGEAGVEPDEYPRVCCTDCGLEVDEDEAQALRWGYWFVVGELFPYCPECARREFGRPPVAELTRCAEARRGHS